MSSPAFRSPERSGWRHEGGENNAIRKVREIMDTLARSSHSKLKSFPQVLANDP